MPLDAAIDNCTAALSKLLPQEIKEIGSYIEEPEVPEDVQQAAAAASQALKDAKAAVGLLKAERNAAFEAARTVQAPPPELKAAVEAVCTMLEARPDFHDAQSRLLKTGAFFADKLLAYDLSRIPRMARSRLGAFVAAPPPAPASADADPLKWVTGALRTWALAFLDSEAAA